MQQVSARALESKLDRLLLRVGPRSNPYATLRAALAVKEAVESSGRADEHAALIETLRDKLQEQVDADLDGEIWLASDGYWCSIEGNMMWHARGKDLTVARIRSPEAVEPVVRWMLGGARFPQRSDVYAFSTRGAL